MWKRRWLVPTVAVAALSLAACGGGDSGAASAGDGEPITIGVPVGLTGANSVIAPSIVQASELAVEEINKSGGVLGRLLELKVYDDQSGAEGAVKAFTTAVLKDKVTAIVGMETSAARNAGQPIALKANTPYVYTSNYEGAACANNLYIPAAVPEQMTVPALEYLNGEMKAKTWFLIGSDYAYGRGALEFVREAVAKSGGQVVGDEYNPVDSPDWTNILQKLRSAKPDAVVTALAGGAPHITFFQQWQQGGFDQPHLNLSIDEDTVKALGASAAGVYYPSPYFTAVDNPKNVKLQEDLKAKFGNKAQSPNYLSVPQYNGIHLLALAIEKAGKTDADAILDALPDVSFDGPSGTVKTDKQHHASMNMWMGQVQTDGSTKVVKDFGLVDPGEQCPDLDD